MIPRRLKEVVRVACGIPQELMLNGKKAAYNEDGLATIHNCDFMQDERFMKAYQIGKMTGSWGPYDIYWRAYVACWAATQAARLEGDFVECGVNRGGLASVIMSYVNFQNLHKTFYLLDTFCGLVPEYITDEEKKLGRLPGQYEECYEFVRKTFSHFSNVQIIKGTIPDALTRVTTQQVAYLSIDMNCVIPEIASINYFWDKLVPGGIVLLDDYAQNIFKPQKEGFDRWSFQRKVPILQLPTGQGIIIR